MKKSKIVFTDLDGTLVTTKTGNKFPKSIYDWELIPDMVTLLKDYKLKGYKIILVTNQGGIEKGFIKSKDFYKKLDLIQTSMNLQFDEIFVAESLKSDLRKPKCDKLEEDLKYKNIHIDKEKSFMVGDAGGRKLDFSDSDLKFSNNLGVDFVHADDVSLII